jgi:hypothetical protein
VRRGQLPPRRVDIPSELAGVALSEDLRRQLENKTLVNCITAGRTGTKYASVLFGLLPGVYACHEEKPSYVSVMRRCQKDTQESFRFLIETKLPLIAQVKQPIYLETSHLFCKGFFEPMVKLDLCPDLLLLRREPRQIALSLLAKVTVPKRTRLGVRYLLSPEDPNVLPLTEWTRMTDYQLCFWYALEIERRQDRYGMMALRQGKRVVDITAREMNSFAVFRTVAQDLGIWHYRDGLEAEHVAASAKVHNPIPGARMPLPQALDAQEGEVWDSIRLHEPLLRQKVQLRYETTGQAP